MTDKLSRFHQDAEAVEELTKLLDAIHGPDRPTQGNGTWRFTEGGASRRRPAVKRYCEMCDRWWPAKKTECPECGMPTRKAAK